MIPLSERLVDGGQDRLAVGVATLVLTDVAQLRRRQSGELRADLGSVSSS